MKRKTRSFLDCAKDSLFLAVEMFNRPFDAGRTEGVLLFLNHAFEMLLKAVVLEKTGRIRGRREKLNYTFEKCLNICESESKQTKPDINLSCIVGLTQTKSRIPQNRISFHSLDVGSAELLFVADFA